MDAEKLKQQIGANIAAYRKQAGLTQAGLAEKLNYSDKAVSKWERGESVPDVLTLAQLAEQFGITVNDLLVDPNALPEETGVVQQAMEQVVEKTLKRKADKRIILMLSSILCWFVALLLYVVLMGIVVFRGAKFCKNGNWLHAGIYGAVLMYLLAMVIGTSSVTVSPIFWMLAGIVVTDGKAAAEAK